jgi:hypothetical protein
MSLLIGSYRLKRNHHEKGAGKREMDKNVPGHNGKMPPLDSTVDATW